MRLKSPAARLFTHPFIQAQIKENIEAPRHWPLWGEFTSNAENVSIWWRHHAGQSLIQLACQWWATKFGKDFNVFYLAPPYSIHPRVFLDFSARLQYLLCISNGDTTVLHIAIEFTQQFGIIKSWIDDDIRSLCHTVFTFINISRLELEYYNW